MRVKGIIEEDFVNYKVPSMFINTCFCDFKCCTELGLDVRTLREQPYHKSRCDWWYGTDASVGRG